MKIFYVHGIGSAGGGNTVRMLKEKYPTFEIISPDIPVDPIEAFEFVKENVKDCDMIIGTSLGGFYTMMVHGIPKILINPAMNADETVENVIGLGTHEFLKNRKNGETTYTVDREFVDKLTFLKNRFFNEWLDEEYTFETYGLFGTEDDVTNCQDIFKKYYRTENMTTAKFGHRITEEVFNNDLTEIIDNIIADDRKWN